MFISQLFTRIYHRQCKPSISQIKINFGLFSSPADPSLCQLFQEIVHSIEKAKTCTIILISQSLFFIPCTIVQPVLTLLVNMSQLFPPVFGLTDPLLVMTYLSFLENCRNLGSNSYPCYQFCLTLVFHTANKEKFSV